MQLPIPSSPYLGGRRPRRRPLAPLRRYQWITFVAVVIASGGSAFIWAGSDYSESAGPLVASQEARTIAGEPSESIQAAARAVPTGTTPSETAEGSVPKTSGDRSTEDETATPQATSTSVEPATVVSETSSEAPGAGPSNAEIPSSETPNSEAPTSDVPSGRVAPPTDRPTRVFPVNQTARLSTAQLVTIVEDNRITNVADFLSALPPFMGESYTLMEESRSRHLASTEYPRLIMYGPDARILIGISSHPSDPLREVVEIAELDETTGLWRFSQFDFRNAFVHDTDTESCAGCHGSPQRPIWGEYPTWPGAFAGQDERLAGGQATTLMNLKSDPLDRFHHLVFPSDHSIQNNGQFYLPTRDYGYANTSFNFELNAAVADGIARRIIAHPNWATDGYRLLAVQWDCARSVDAAGVDAMYNRFGIDGNNDFQLESLAFEARADQRDEYDWNQGSTGLDNSVAFRTLDLAAQLDPALDAVVGGDQLFVDLSNAWFNILGAQRSTFLQTNGIYEIDFRPQNLGGGFVSRVCTYLETRGS